LDESQEARKKLADYQAKTADGRTDAQQEKVQALERSYQNAQARLESFQRSVSTIGAALRETGANTDQLSSVTARLADEELAAAAAQKRVNEELRNYVDTVNKARYVLDVVLKAIKTRVRAGHSVELRGLVKFEVVNKKARERIDMADVKAGLVGAAVRRFTVPAHAVVKATASPRFLSVGDDNG
jgi:nucleoid DNA-binding protein